MSEISEFTIIEDQYEVVNDLLLTYQSDQYMTREKSSELSSQMSNLISMLRSLCETLNVVNGDISGLNEETRQRLLELNDRVKQKKADVILFLSSAALSFN